MRISEPGAVLASAVLMLVSACGSVFAHQLPRGVESPYNSQYYKGSPTGPGDRKLVDLTARTDDWGECTLDVPLADEPKQGLLPWLAANPEVLVVGGAILASKGSRREAERELEARPTSGSLFDGPARLVLKCVHHGAEFRESRLVGSFPLRFEIAYASGGERERLVIKVKSSANGAPTLEVESDTGGSVTVANGKLAICEEGVRRLIEAFSDRPDAEGAGSGDDYYECTRLGTRRPGPF